jgi:hypothetical protein
MSKRVKNKTANVAFSELYFLPKSVKCNSILSHYTDTILYNLDIENIIEISKRVHIFRESTGGGYLSGPFGNFCFIINKIIFCFQIKMLITKDKGIEYVNPIYIKLSLDNKESCLKFPKNINHILFILKVNSNMIESSPKTRLPWSKIDVLQ